MQLDKSGLQENFSSVYSQIQSSSKAGDETRIVRAKYFFDEESLTSCKTDDITVDNGYTKFDNLNKCNNNQELSQKAPRHI